MNEINIIPKENNPEKGNSKSIRIKTYNCYADCFTDGYWEDNNWHRIDPLIDYMIWDKRKEILLQDMLENDVDIICLQEVEPELMYKKYFEKKMNEKGYEGVMQNKKKFGNCTFYKRDKFQMVYKSDRSRILIVQLKVKNDNDNGELIYVNNCHLEGNPYEQKTRFNQIKSMFKHTFRRKDYENGSIIICGDFNETETEGIYELLSTGKLNDKKYNKGEYIIRNNIQFKSVCYQAFKKEPMYTMQTKNYKQTIDFIFYWGKKIQLVSVANLVRNKDDIKELRIPNPEYPSDHLSIMGEFLI